MTDKITFRVTGTGSLVELARYYCLSEDEDFFHDGSATLCNKPLEPICSCDIFNSGCTCQRLNWEKSS